MAFLKSVIVLLAVIASVDGFSVGGNVPSSHNAVAPRPLMMRTASSLARRNNMQAYKHSSSQSTLRMSSSDIQDDSPWYSQVSIPYAVALAVFLGFAAFLAPGEFGSEVDNGMIQAYIDNPVAPNLNPIFNAEFNLLGAAPLVLAGLVCPQAVSSRGLPPAPFLAASAFAGYGGLGM